MAVWFVIRKIKINWYSYFVFFFQEYIFVLKMFTWKRWQKSNRSRRRFIAIDPDWASAGPGQVWIESKNHRVSAWVAARSRRIDKTLPGIPSLFWFLNFFMIDHFNFLRSLSSSILQLKANKGGVTKLNLRLIKKCSEGGRVPLSVTFHFLCKK